MSGINKIFWILECISICFVLKSLFGLKTVLAQQRFKFNWFCCFVHGMLFRLTNDVHNKIVYTCIYIDMNADERASKFELFNGRARMYLFHVCRCSCTVTVADYATMHEYTMICFVGEPFYYEYTWVIDISRSSLGKRKNGAVYT